MRTYAAALVVLAGLYGAPAVAADLPTKKPAPEEIVAPVLPSTWHYEITGYGWGTDLAGQAGRGTISDLAVLHQFPQAPRTLPGRVDDLLRRPQRHVHRRASTSFWSRIGAGTNFENPTSALFGDHATLTLTKASSPPSEAIRIPVGPPNLQLYGTLGARYFYIHTGFDLSFPVVGFEPNFGLTKNWVDPVAGLAAHYAINDKYFINFLTDLGGLDNSATGQVLGSVGYNWTPSFSTTLGYRVLYTYFRDEQRTSPRLPLSVMDVRAVRWGQIQLLIRSLLRLLTSSRRRG